MGASSSGERIGSVAADNLIEAGRGPVAMDPRCPANMGRQRNGDDGEAEDLGAAFVYLRQAQRYPTLSAAESRACCAALRRAAREIAESEHPAPAAQNAFESSRQRLIRGHLRLVVAIARHYRHPNLTLGDLVQEGNIGLMEAIPRFDPGKGIPFSTFAAEEIRHSICRALSLKSRPIRIPLREITLRRRAARVASDLEQRIGNERCDGAKRRLHRIEDDARELGVTPDRLRKTIRRVADVESLDSRADPAAAPLLETLADAQAPDPAAITEKEEERRCLAEAISRLPDRLQQIVRERYGLTGGGQKGLAEIGEEIHLSPQRVHQLIRQALDRLREERGLRPAAPTRPTPASAASRRGSGPCSLRAEGRRDGFPAARA